MIEEILLNKSERIDNIGDVFSFGGSMVLIGMATIFAVLCALWGCLVLFKIFFHDLPEKKAKAAVETVSEEVAAPVATETFDESEIIAVIAAAIAMAESESTDTKFRVVSFKRK